MQHPVGAVSAFSGKIITGTIPVELRAQFHEFLYTRRTFFHYELNHIRVAQTVSCLQSIGDMTLH